MVFGASRCPEDLPPPRPGAGRWLRPGVRRGLPRLRRIGGGRGRPSGGAAAPGGDGGAERRRRPRLRGEENHLGKLSEIGMIWWKFGGNLVENP